MLIAEFCCPNARPSPAGIQAGSSTIGSSVLNDSAEKFSFDGSLPVASAGSGSSLGPDGDGESSAW